MTQPPPTLRIFIGAVVLFAVGALVFGIPLVRQATLHGRIARLQLQLSALATAAQAYFQSFGTLPEVVDAQTLRALAGENPARTVFLEIPPGWTNAEGLLLDPWGHVPRILLNAQNQVEARSAGSKGEFGDADDVLATAGLRKSAAADPNP